MVAKVLLVEDDRALREALADTLQLGGHAYRAVDCAESALLALAQEPFSLVVSDVNMPNMDGLTMAEKIRGELGNTSVNLIMLTTESSPSMKERGKAAGIKGWIVKPFNGTAVLETFKKLAA